MQVRVLYWQEIPSLIRVTTDDGTQVSRQLPDWFQQEIDRVAMEQGLAGSDAYLEQWAWRDLEPRTNRLARTLMRLGSQLHDRLRRGGRSGRSRGGTRRRL